MNRRHQLWEKGTQLTSNERRLHFQRAFILSPSVLPWHTLPPFYQCLDRSLLHRDMRSHRKGPSVECICLYPPITFRSLRFVLSSFGFRTCSHGGVIGLRSKLGKTAFSFSLTKFTEHIIWITRFVTKLLQAIFRQSCFVTSSSAGESLCSLCLPAIETVRWHTSNATLSMCGIYTGLKAM